MSQIGLASRYEELCRNNSSALPETPPSRKENKLT